MVVRGSDSYTFLSAYYYVIVKTREDAIFANKLLLKNQTTQYIENKLMGILHQGEEYCSD